MLQSGQWLVVVVVVVVLFVVVVWRCSRVRWVWWSVKRSGRLWKMALWMFWHLHQLARKTWLNFVNACCAGSRTLTSTSSTTQVALSLLLLYYHFYFYFSSDVSCQATSHHCRTQHCFILLFAFYAFPQFPVAIFLIFLLWPPDSYAGRRPLCLDLSCRFRLDLLSLLFFSPLNLRGRLADRHQTLPRVRWWPRFMKFGQIFWEPLLPEIWRPKKVKFWRDFGQLRDLIANISRTQQDIVNWKTALQTTDTPARANLIWCTLLHKWRKIDQSSDPPTGHSSEDWR